MFPGGVPKIFHVVTSVNRIEEEKEKKEEKEKEKEKTRCRSVPDGSDNEG